MDRRLLFLILSLLFMATGGHRRRQGKETCPAGQSWVAEKKGEGKCTKKNEICPVGQHWIDEDKTCVNFKTVITGLSEDHTNMTCPPGLIVWRKKTCIKRVIKPVSCSPKSMWDKEKNKCVLWLIEKIGAESEAQEAEPLKPQSK